MRPGRNHTLKYSGRNHHDRPGQEENAVERRSWWCFMVYQISSGMSSVPSLKSEATAANAHIRLVLRWPLRMGPRVVMTGGYFMGGGGRSFAWEGYTRVPKGRFVLCY